MPRSPSNKQSWYDWAVKRLDEGSYLDKLLLSFVDEAQYHDFNRRHGRGKYTINHTLTDFQSGRFHVWVTKR